MQKKFTKTFILLAIIIIIAIILEIFNVYDLIRKQIYKQEYSEYVNKYAEIYEIDPMWIYAIIKVESNFNPNTEYIPSFLNSGKLNISDNRILHFLRNCTLTE